MMVRYFVYLDTTGEIVREGVCPEDMVSLQAYDLNEIAVEGEVDGEVQYFDLLTETVEYKTASPVTIDTSTTIVVTQDDHDKDIWLNFPVGTIVAFADGLYNMAFENIPNPSQLYFNGEFLTEITDGDLEFGLDFPSSPATIEVFRQVEPLNLGLHTIEIKTVSSLPFEVSIYAV